MIIGNGEDEQTLKNEIKKNNCQETFKLIGYRENPFAYFKLAACFYYLLVMKDYRLLSLNL